MHRILLAALAGSALLSAPAHAQTPSKYDGRWSVLIVTEHGNCDRAYRYPLIIANGHVLYGGKKNFTVSGMVQKDGTVDVGVYQGQYGAQGSGRLSGKYGVGKWAAPAGGCWGRWQADKRG